MDFIKANVAQAVEQFASLPYPAEDCSGKVVVVTGANRGLGLEAVRHFVRLDAARVIVACRDPDKGEEARRDVEATTQRMGVVEVWQLDLGSFDSVKEFGARIDALERLDVLVNNAGLLNLDWELAEGHEKQTTVNVISTLLLSVMALPALRRTGARFNITPHLVIVSSGASEMVYFPERKSDNIMHTLATNESIWQRYNITKLLQVIMATKLAEAADASGKGHVIVNVLNPGLCQTDLFRHSKFPFSVVMRVVLAVVARSAEVGSRTLMAASWAGEEAHGQWLSSCKVAQLPTTMRGEEGSELSGKIWGELLEILDGIQPGVTDLI